MQRLREKLSSAKPAAKCPYDESIVAAESRISAFLAAEKYDDALKASIEAAEYCMKLGKRAQKSADKKKLQQKREEFTAGAVNIQELRKGRDNSPTPLPVPQAMEATKSQDGLQKRTDTTRTPPLSITKLSIKEETLLLKSSKVNNDIFPPWENLPGATEFSGSIPFSDPSGLLELSDLQFTMLEGWKRPNELYQGNARIYPEEGTGSVFDLAQDVITDCSVVASLCSAIAREERSLGKLVSNILYPQDIHGNPKTSPSGKYFVKLYFNGCYRKVVIDDLLPASNNKHSLYVTCRNNPSVFYPALIEKAYLKVMGGYDFPGSNSGTDLLALTSWIPEHVFLQSNDINQGNLWKRILKAWDRGDVLITLGTESMSRREESELGLVGEHDYAVLGLKDEDGEKWLQVKNPWSEGATYTGVSGVDSDEGEDEDCEDEDGDGDDDEDEAGPAFKTENLRESLPIAVRKSDSCSPGVFWISLDSVFRHFASIYLNWNPALFTHRQDLHFAWDLSTKRSEGCISRNPQFSVTNNSSKSALIWLLLGRHLTSTTTGEDYDPKKKKGYISLYVFDNQGRRAYRSEGALHRGPYVDSPQTLLRLDEMPPKTTYTVAVSSQDLPRTPHTFTLSAFSLTPLQIRDAEDPYTYHRTLQSQWLPETAGGNAQSPTYSNNPQFRLSISKPCNLLLLLEARETLSAHVKLVWGGGKRIASVTTRDIITESGEYRRGCAIAEATNLQAGEYTVVASTFEPDQIGDFTLSVETTSADAVFEPIASESAGKMRKTVEGIWKDGANAVAYPFEVERLTVVSVKARTIWASSRAQPMLRVSVEKMIGRRGKEQKASSPEGEYSDVPQGVRTGDIDVEVDWGYRIVLGRMGDASGGGNDSSQYELEILSDGVVHLACSPAILAQVHG
ncbi:uncharacterized protein LAJ45_06273 [Morchella importuna]|uniref:uncharacterized protein n=1 Tax=Morchella importuna TaxID=1174673 RepID=UPI001E8C9EFC|nr:uncharacterized protein LAJ45_06273 [Morchella importuna]KAH8149642.1 hypothetical protein LAJ45_06273 [Morchella importuna]